MQSKSFTKLFASITDSSIWGEDDATRIIWITMLAMADSEGYVGASIPGLAARARKSVAEVEHALTKFKAPDPYSRTRDFDGRRVADAEGGWVLLTYEKHRSITRAESLRESKRQWAERARDAARLAANEVEPSRTGVEPSRTKIEKVEPESNSALCTLLSGSGSDQGGAGGSAGVPATPAPVDTLKPAAPVEAQGVPVMFHTLDAWVEPEGLEDEAFMAGVPREFYRARLAACRNTTIGGRNGVRCQTTWVRSQFGTWKTWSETERAKATRDKVDSGASRAPSSVPGGGVAPGGPPIVLGAKAKAFAAKHNLRLAPILEELQKAGVGNLLEPERSRVVGRALTAHAKLKQGAA